MIDIITLESGPSGATLDSKGISWPTDTAKFQQPQGFQSLSLGKNAVYRPSQGCMTINSPCKSWVDPVSNTTYLYYYPNDKTTQYLYETYPNQISPIEGVTNEHFKGN